ncbi:DUF945 domain-containing protein [Stappia stellulata]|uniref:DUF932 domain-containing protein n=1 Tax=Stappia stellulata TaxID=71235 RepID=UPI001CD78441|nr:DUF932 domain-containing protein [Stappia stellulata]MCA1241859.1 DUF945 domain-containing protein [Stappia stellulata]
MSIYANTARFDGAKVLGEDELRRLAPSVFATSAHESRSDRFQPIPTIEILRGLMAEGFMPVGVKQSRSRDASKVHFTKHMLRLRRIDEDSSLRVGDTVCEILLKNANDGSSAYDLMAGLFRIRCLNSLVAQTGTIDSVKVRHSGDVQGKVIEGTYRVMEEAQKALAAPASWAGVELARDERMAFAEAAHVLRFGDADGNIDTPITPEQLLSPRRRDDRAADLWTTFNVAQENVIRGGLRGITRDANGRRRRVSTRAVNGIDQDVKLNKALWILSQRMAEMKGADSLAA